MIVLANIGPWWYSVAAFPVPFTASELADRLLSKPVTPERVSKLRRLLARDPWSRPPMMDTRLVEAFLGAVEAHPNGGENTRAFVHQTLARAPQRTIPDPPPDIAAKVEAFQKKQAEMREAKR